MNTFPDTVSLYRVSFGKHCQELEERRKAAVDAHASQPNPETKLIGVDTARMSNNDLDFYRMMLGAIKAGPMSGADFISVSFSFLGFLSRLEEKLDALT